MAEAPATATPALAFPTARHRRSSTMAAPGTCAPDQDEMTAAVARVPRISRRRCRAAAERRFFLARMAVGYDRLYRAILEHPGRVTSGRTGTGTP
jgi:hypothetical protein